MRWRTLGLLAAGLVLAAAQDEIVFPEKFAFGTATAAYQIEGGWQEGGRGMSIWDAFSHTAGRIKTGETGDVAADHFHRFRSDVRLMAQMKLKYYRFSISWSRLIPSGFGAVNEEGVRFYSELIDELIAHGIHPVVTLYHWDLPLALQTERDGWLTEATASSFVHYAALCFARFGDRVKHWITFNEPANAAVYGHARGEHAPGRTINPTREPYVAGHYMLLAHAYAVSKYRNEYQAEQGGMISIALNSDWREPTTGSAVDAAAAQRSMEFTLGWFADPIYFGDYPTSMRQRVGSRLPQFTEVQRRLVLNSTDFFALQHYSTMMVSEPHAGEAPARGSFHADEGTQYHSVPGAGKNALGWDVAPFGIHKLVRWVHKRYAPYGGIVITENGYAGAEEDVDEARRDNKRVCYIKQYLQQLRKAMDAGVDVRGYFVWTLLDNFEWREGTKPRFGLLHVDFETQKRSAKASAAFFARLSEKHAFSLSAAECNASSPVHQHFADEGAELELILNRTRGSSSDAKVTRDMAARGKRLAVIADMQARYNAEQGEFRMMRAWIAKGERMRSFAASQAARLKRLQGEQPPPAAGVDGDAAAAAGGAAAAAARTAAAGGEPAAAAAAAASGGATADAAGALAAEQRAVEESDTAEVESQLEAVLLGLPEDGVFLTAAAEGEPALDLDGDGLAEEPGMQTAVVEPEPTDEATEDRDL